MQRWEGKLCRKNRQNLCLTHQNNPPGSCSEVSPDFIMQIWKKGFGWSKLRKVCYMTCWMRSSWMVMPSASCYVAVLGGSILQAPLKPNTSLPLRILRVLRFLSLVTCSAGWDVCWSWLWIPWIWATPQPTGQSKQLCYTFSNCCREKRPRSLGMVSRLRRDSGGNFESCW